MRALQVEHPGASDVLRLKEIERPILKEGEVLIQNELIGLNYVDVYYRKGNYAATTLPFTPGVEGAGTVVEVGPGVSNLQKGTRVAYAMQLGAYAEYTAVPLNRVYSLPQEISFESAIVHFLQGMTALFLVKMLSKVEIDSYSSVLFRGAGSGVGKILLPLLAQKNISVLATTRSKEKGEALMRSGAQKIILDHGDSNAICKNIQEQTSPSKISVIYDSVGGVDTWAFLSCLKPRGLYVLFGQSAGAVPAIDPQLLSQHGSLFLTRPSLTHYITSFEETKLLGDELFGKIVSMGEFNQIDKIFSLEEAAQAHHYLEQRDSLGKVVLKL